MNSVMTNEQYNMLKGYNEVVSKIADAMANNPNFDGLMSDYDTIRRLDGIEIYSMIQDYEEGELKDSASIVLSNSMVIVIIEAESDYVFGYVPYEDGTREFFLSEIEYEFDSEEGELKSVFRIGDDEGKFDTGLAMRIGR